MFAQTEVLCFCAKAALLKPQGLRHHPPLGCTVSCNRRTLLPSQLPRGFALWYPMAIPLKALSYMAITLSYSKNERQISLLPYLTQRRATIFGWRSSLNRYSLYSESGADVKSVAFSSINPSLQRMVVWQQ